MQNAAYDQGLHCLRLNPAGLETSTGGEMEWFEFLWQVVWGVKVFQYSGLIEK